MLSSPPRRLMNSLIAVFFPNIIEETNKIHLGELNLIPLAILYRRRWMNPANVFIRQVVQAYPFR
jgi:hypothetical protein